MGHAGNQLPDRRHFFALKKLFLRAAEGLVGLARLFEQEGFIDCGGDLIADGRQQI